MEPSCAFLIYGRQSFSGKGTFTYDGSYLDLNNEKSRPIQSNKLLEIVLQIGRIAAI